MPFFSDDDISRVGRDDMGVPDGVVDASHYLNVFKFVHESLKDLDPANFESKIKFMMSILNPIYMDKDAEILDKRYVFDLITCMSFHIVQLLMGASMLSDDFKEQYVHLVESQIIPVMDKECQALPYWDSNG
jgi:hypothetical protein